MEKLKNFMTSPKKTAVLGLVGAIMMLFSMFPIYLYSIFYNFNIIGLVVYFIIILMRLYKQQGNVKVANYTLLITFLLTIISNPIISVAEGESFIIETLVFIIVIVYLVNILLGKTKLLNNKIFAITLIGYSIYMLVSMLMFNPIIDFHSIIFIVKYLGYIAIVPYFYNYYNLIKEENKNG